jgi:hypothetical protein
VFAVKLLKFTLLKPVGTAKSCEIVTVKFTVVGWHVTTFTSSHARLIMNWPSASVKLRARSTPETVVFGPDALNAVFTLLPALSGPTLPVPA